MEWGIAIAGMVILSGALGLILFRAVTNEARPANLSVTLESIAILDQGYRVDFRVDNSGTETAAAVTIEGELSKGGQSVEKSNATLVYVPANSTRKGGMFFTNDPNGHEVKLRAAGFEKP